MNRHHQAATSYLIKYNTFLRILLLVGLGPFSLNRKTFRMHCTWPALTYGCLISLISLTISALIIYQRIMLTIQRIPTTTSLLASLIQTIVCFSAFGITNMIFISKRLSHVQFLNGIADFDQQMCSCSSSPSTCIIDPITYVKSINGNHFYCKILLETSAYACITVTLMWISNYAVPDPIGSAQMKMLHYLIAMMLLSMHIIIFHIRASALALDRRQSYVVNLVLQLSRQDWRWICDELEWEKFKIAFQLLERMFWLRTQFVNLFGVGILLNVAYDLVLFILSLNMFVSLRSEHYTWHMLELVVVTFFLCPFVKTVMLVVAVENLAKWVAIYTNSSVPVTLTQARLICKQVIC